MQWLVVLAVFANAKAVETIVGRNIFCSGCERGATAGGAGVRTSLPLELVSTMRCPSDERWSVAVILSTADHVPRMYARGSSVGGAELVRIGARRVELRVGERLEVLALEGLDGAPPPSQPPPAGAPTGIACSAGHCQVDRALVQRVLADPGALAATVRVAPATGGGLALLAVRPDSPLFQLGLRSGDRVRAVNHVPLAGVDEMLQLLAQLRNATNLSVELERQGQRQTLDYQIR